MYFGDMTYMLLLPVLIFAGWAQMKVSSTFAQFARVPTRSRYTGEQAARHVLNAEGLHHVAIEQIPGRLSDHYDPRGQVWSLSPEVYNGDSLAAVGVACHEVGHAIQHAHSYFPLQIRQFIFPVAQFGSFAAWPLFFLGFLFSSFSLMDLGIAVFTVAALFQIALCQYKPVVGFRHHLQALVFNRISSIGNK